MEKETSRDRNYSKNCDHPSYNEQHNTIDFQAVVDGETAANDRIDKLC